MSLNNPSPGPNCTAEYLVAGVPFITSSILPVSGTIGIDFPYVTRTIRVRNIGAGNAQLGVTQLGAKNTNYFILPSGSSEEFNIRTRQFWAYSLQGTTLSVFAGLTTIEARMFPILTASSPSNIPGVG